MKKFHNFNDSFIFFTVSEIILRAYIPTLGNSVNLWHGTPWTNPSSTGYPAIVLCSRPFSRRNRKTIPSIFYDSYENGTRINTEKTSTRIRYYPSMNVYALVQTGFKLECCFRTAQKCLTILWQNNLLAKHFYKIDSENSFNINGI